MIASSAGTPEATQQALRVDPTRVVIERRWVGHPAWEVTFRHVQGQLLMRFRANLRVWQPPPSMADWVTEVLLPYLPEEWLLTPLRKPATNQDTYTLIVAISAPVI